MRNPRKGTILQTHARYFCTCVEKKVHTSKRVSVIARDNVISKAKLCAAYTRIFRTPKETSKIHQILAVLGKIILIKILPFWERYYLIKLSLF